ALEPGDLDVIEEAAGSLVIATDEGCTIALDPSIDEALRLEGIARELVNRVQRLRKDSGLAVSDRIELALFGDDDIVRVAEQYRDYIAGETLASRITYGAVPEESWSSDVHEVDLDGLRVRIGIRRA